MGLESATYIDNLVATNPTSGDLKSQGDDHIRLVKAVLQATFPRAGKAFPFYTVLTKTSNYSVLSTDEHTFFIGDGASAGVDFGLPALSSGDKGWFCFVYALNLTNAVTVTPASGTINGLASFTVTPTGALALVWWTGSTWYASIDKIAIINELSALTAPAADDVLPIYDTSGTANFKITLENLFKVINLITALTAPATGDKVAVFDADASAAKAITLENLLKVVNALTEDTAPDAAADFLLTYDNSASAAKKTKPSSFGTQLNPFGTQLLHVRDEKTSGTEGGTFTSGAWQTRDLNTSLTNEITGASLGSDQITLPAGSYFVEASAPAFGNLIHQLRFRNVSDATTALLGQNVKAGSVDGNAGNLASVKGRFTIAAEKVFELQHRTTNTRNNDGLGAAAGFGTEVYAEVLIWKVG